jgi:hypothetical protein
METARPRIYRPRAVLVLALAGAGLFWLAMFVGLWPLRSQVGLFTVWGCFAFVVFFALLWAYHAAMRIELDEAGITYRGLVKRLRVGFEDVVKVDVNRTLALTLYLVLTRKGLILFSSHFKAHRELLEQLVARAGLRGR